MKLLFTTFLLGLSASAFSLDYFDRYEVLDKNCAVAHGQHLCIGDNVSFTDKNTKDGVKRIGWKVVKIVKSNTGADLIGGRKMITSVITHNEESNSYYLPSSSMKVKKESQSLTADSFSLNCYQNICAGDKVYPGDTGFYPEESWVVIGINPKTKEVLSKFKDKDLYVSKFKTVVKE